MTEVGSAYVTIYPDTSGFSSAIAKALGAEDIGGKTGKSISEGILSPLKVALGVTLGNLATKAGQAIGANLSEGISRYDTIKNFPKLMETFGYSTDSATDSIRNIQKHLDGLPGSTDEVLRLVQSLSDSTGSLELATSTGLAFNDMLTAAGADATTAAMATRMFDQMMGGAEFSSQRWYAIVSKMPLQMRMVAEHILGAGASVEDLGAALESGQVSMQDMAQAMTDLSPQFEEQARAMSNGIGTAMTNVSHRIAQGITEILDAFGQENIAGAINSFSSGFRDALGEVGGAIEFVITRIDELGVTDKLKQVAQGILDFLGIDENSFATFRENVYGVLNVLVEWIDGALQWLIDNGETIGGILRPIADGFADFISRAGEWLIASGEALGQVLDTVFQSFTDSDPGIVVELANAIGEIGAALGDAIMDGFDWLAQNPDLLQSIIFGVGTAITTTAIVTLLPQLAYGLGLVARALVLFFSSNIVALILGAVAALIYFFTQTDEGKAIIEGFVNGVKQWWEIFSTRTKEIFEGISQFFTETWENIKNWAVTTAEGIVTSVTTWWENVKKSTEDTWNAIKKFFEDTWNGIKTTVTDIVEGIVNGFKQWWGNVKTSTETTWNAIKTTVSNVVNAVKDTISNVFNGVKDTVTSIWNGIKDAMTGPIETAKETIRNIIETIEGFFNFDWKLPDIKLPHIEATGWTDFPLIGQIPTGFYVNWYAQGGVVDGATLIGAGEAGPEAIVPLSGRYAQPFAKAIAAEMDTGGSVTVSGNTFVVREEADIDRIAEQLNWLITRERMGALT